MTDFHPNPWIVKKSSALSVFFGAFVKKLCKPATHVVFAAFGGPLLGAAATAGVLEEAPAVPSGNVVSLHEVLFETRADTSRVARFRYVMPVMQQGVTFAEIEGDFFHLCNGVAVPYLAVSEEKVDQVIISMADRETEFGVMTHLAQQYFEAFSVQDGICIWEGF
ncbi:DUF6497 family protein [Shimia sp. R9_3]|uniref:DUF6497 family protein n=1 Tax=Shimia sp. R9_3 TaxID=2821113 RepID=UPI001ADA7B4B|nr:DUF6497 family protein [Shimia sp. R9_3]MBO9403171.1 hypothetical protein [Shimia sp. R9_3]